MEESLASSSAKQSAEAKHQQMESELSDLSVNLFSTAIDMVAAERQVCALIEESLVSTQATVVALEKQLALPKRMRKRPCEAKMRTEHEMGYLLAPPFLARLAVEYSLVLVSFSPLS